MPVIRNRGRCKNRATVKDRQKLLLSGSHISVPELEMSTVLFFPILVEVDEKVNAALQIQSWVMVEVRMDRKFTAGFYLVKPSPEIIRIGDDPLDTRQN